MTSLLTSFPRFSRLRGLLAVGCLLTAMLAPAPARAQVQETSITVKAVHTFRGVGEGAFPYGGLLKADDGYFYGTTYAGGVGTRNGGTVFRVAPDGTLTTLVSYEAAQPYSTLALGIDGNFYGSASAGGKSNAGFLFRVLPDGSSAIISTFDPTRSGNTPRAGLVTGADGYLYGTTTAGGTYGGGTVFRLNKEGDLSTLYSFNPANGGGTRPYGVLVQGRDGLFYGTTYSDGAYGVGTVFKVSILGGVNTVHSFRPETEGGNPRVGLLLGKDGLFYGTTNSGGAASGGTVFQLTPQGTLTVLHAFNPAQGDGTNAASPLVDGGDGRLYGATTGGGTSNNGTLFAVTASGGFTTLYSFTGGSDGSQPIGPLVPSGDGIFYGTASAGGDLKGLGTVFRLNLRTPPAIPGTLAFAAALTSVSQSAGSATLTVNRVGGTTGAVGVSFLTLDRTARAGTDYIERRGVLSWLAEDATPKTITVPLVDLGLSGGGTRTFSVQLSEPTGGASLGDPATADVSIVQDAPPPPPFVPTLTLKVKGDGTATVGGTGAKVLFTRDGDLSRELVVTYRLKGPLRNGTDYDLLSGTLTIPAGQTKYNLKVKAKRTANFKGKAALKIQPNMPEDGSLQVSPAKVKVKFVNPN